MSPQTKKQKKEYIEGAEEGMIFNTVTEELIDGAEGITVVPCYFEPVALEWTDRGTGSSAPVAQHPVDTPLWDKTKKDELGKARLPEGTLGANSQSLLPPYRQRRTYYSSPN